MLLLADENFPKPVVDELRADGHDVLWARTHLSGWRDRDLLEEAERTSRIILTLDRDFFQIAIQRPVPLENGGVVLFRVHPATTDRLAPLVRGFVNAGHAWAGHVSVVTEQEVRMTPSRGPSS
jgi:predicted nuclease of predicted toxin-antitoxin system